ncbi:MAG: patatin-like phospholipase family protein [Myxococcota bacterium]|nr:patatin-like phospholipase family protein [Myxococcota bacterium]
MIAVEEQLSIRKPLQDIEGVLVRLAMAHPVEMTEPILDDLRYIVSFARMTTVRNSDGVDIYVADALTLHRKWIQDFLNRLLDSKSSLDVLSHLPKLREETRVMRRKILHHFPLDRDSLEAEVCERQLVLVLGGGGGGGYGYTGALNLLNRYKLQPSLLAGTSIGALVGMFRARNYIYDPLPMYEAAKQLQWNTVFRVLEMKSRYGIPATLRLYLRHSLGSMFQYEDGSFMRFSTAEIPLLVVTTGITMDAFKHDLSYYEHFMDDALLEGERLRVSRIRRVTRIFSIIQEFLSNREALKEVVFGLDPLTMEADVLDAAGFSAAVPGLIHYDIIRDSPKMHRLLEALYAEYGITRLGEGGLVNNVPSRPAYQAVMQGRITRRNPFVLSMDCFSPQTRSLLWYPIQQLVQFNVRQNLPYSSLYFALNKRLKAINVVPSVDQISKAIEWTISEFEPHMPYISRMCKQTSVLSEQ